MEPIKTYRAKAIYPVIMVLISGVVYAFCEYINNDNIYDIIKMAIMGCIMTIPVFFAIMKCSFKLRPYLFAICYFLSLSMVILTRFVSPLLYPTLGVIVIFYVISDLYVSMLSFVSVAMLLAVISNQPYLLLVYLPAVIILLIMLNTGRFESITLPVIASNFVYLLIYSSIVLNLTDVITPDLYIYPLGGFVINVTVSIICLFSFKRYVINKYDDAYILINDPEYNLLLQLKEKNNEEYKIAIHTAYLCDRVSSNLSLNRSVAKCLGYYHRIGVLLDGKISENTIKLAKDNNFPPTLYKEIELYEKSGWKYPVSKESTVLNYCSEVIKTILQYIKNFPDRQPDYEAIIDKIFEHKHANNTCRGSELSLKELDRLKQYLKDEKIYYDFLR